jgi:hypothetical protein
MHVLETSICSVSLSIGKSMCGNVVEEDVGAGVCVVGCRHLIVSSGRNCAERIVPALQ